MSDVEIDARVEEQAGGVSDVHLDADGGEVIHYSGRMALVMKVFAFVCLFLLNGLLLAVAGMAHANGDVGAVPVIVLTQIIVIGKMYPRW